jgi:GNAT superfamily N-acetyltransferase
MHYRSRGIWVHPEHRREGVAQTLFNLLELQAKNEGCEMIWSIPRKTALISYTKFGFETVGDFIVTETSESNIYVKKRL